MDEIVTLNSLLQKKSPLQTFLLTYLLFSLNHGYSQCVVLENAVQGISYTYVQSGGTNASGVAYNPDFNIYYAVIAGNPGFPYETFDPSGVSLFQTNAGFDFRGLWWNPNANQLEGNGYFAFGLWTSNIDVNGYAQNTGASIFTGQNQPTDQSCGDYDYDTDEIIYYSNGNIYRYSHSTNAFLGSYTLTGMPVPLTYLNSTSVIYTGCPHHEIGLEDYVDKTILLFDKATGAYTCKSQLPNTAVMDGSFHFSYANNLVWLYDVFLRVWTSYKIVEPFNIGNDTTICTGSSLVLNAGTTSFNYSWSNGSTDTTTTINSGGIYWLDVTSGVCTSRDTIIISDSSCAPLLAFNSSDTDICEKFCVNFFDSSQNNPTAWQWIFQGGSPSTSTSQNPSNICYNNAGDYDVTLITTSATGNDTLFLPGYISVHATPPLPTISQNGYELTASAATGWQWQFNSVDIPGATNQVYTATQTGLYTVIVFDENGCKSSASQFVVLVGVSNLINDQEFSIYPNPNAGTFHLEWSGLTVGEMISLQIENSIGQTVFSMGENNSSPDWKKEITLKDVSGGVYLLQITAGESYIRKKIFVLQ